MLVDISPSYVHLHDIGLYSRRVILVVTCGTYATIEYYTELWRFRQKISVQAQQASCPSPLTFETTFLICYSIRSFSFLMFVAFLKVVSDHESSNQFERGFFALGEALCLSLHETRKTFKAACQKISNITWYDCCLLLILYLPGLFKICSALWISIMFVQLSPKVAEATDKRPGMVLI